MNNARTARINGLRRRKAISIFAAVTVIVSTLSIPLTAEPAAAASAIQLCREGTGSPQTQFTSFSNGGDWLQCTYQSFSPGRMGTLVKIQFRSNGAEYTAGQLADPGLNVQNSGDSGKFTVTTPNGYRTKFHLDDDRGRSTSGQRMAFYWDDCIRIQWDTGTSSLWLNGAPSTNWVGYSRIADIVDSFRADRGYASCSGAPTM